MDKRYRILVLSNYAKLEEVITEFILQGWQPIGGVIVDQERGTLSQTIWLPLQIGG